MRENSCFFGIGRKVGSQEWSYIRKWRHRGGGQKASARIVPSPRRVTSGNKDLN